MKKKNKIILMTLFFLLSIYYSSPLLEAEEGLSLIQAISLGLENNPDLREVIHDKNKAQINLDSARKAFYPEVNLNTSYTRMHLPEKDTESPFPPPEGKIDMRILEYMGALMSTMQPAENNYQTGISIQQPIFLGGKIWLGMKQAERGLEIAEIQLQQKKNELLFQIIQSYYNVVLAQERVEIEKEALNLVKEHKRSAEAGFKAGITLKTDILQAEIEEGKALHSLEVVRNDLVTGKKMLANMIGVNLDDRVLSWPELTPALVLDVETQLKSSLSNRPEIKMLGLNKDLTMINLKIAKSSHLPNIVLSGNYQWQGEEFSLEEGTGSLTLAVSMNIFDRGLSKNKRENLKEDLKKLELKESNLRDLIRIEIEDLLLTIKENQNNIQLQELNLQKAEENLKIESKRYKVGMGTNINVMNAQMLLKQTKIAKMQAEYQYIINLYKLLYKTGQLMEFYEGVICSE